MAAQGKDQIIPSQGPPARKLVSVRTIADIKPIKGNRHLEVAKIDGWNVVVVKGDYTIGQFVVYFEVDSFLPNTEDRFWEYCQPHKVQEYNGQSGYVVKTSMKHGTISQGVIFPLSTFPEIEKARIGLENQLGGSELTVEALQQMDFASALGVKKYDSVYFDAAGYYGQPPIFFPQPGCERAQNVTSLFQEFSDTTFQITEKLDGLPMTIYHVRKDSGWYHALPRNRDSGTERPEYGVCGREHDYIQHEKSVFWIAAKNQNVIKKLRRLGRNLAVQGELCGSSIMANSMGFAEGEHRFYVFGIYDIDRAAWMNANKAFGLCKELNLTHAPVLGRMKLSNFASSIDELLEKAEGKGVLGQNREGLIFRTPNNSWGFKVIANSWLLKYGQHKVDQWGSSNNEDNNHVGHF
ncbi:hypothetical protein PG999_005003 [Apiospora kogelbergensis]|uniref:RNA ligase domain-containing protein n=1 Tax=Apiospora kogelbergensis TaxID=1337665 RepID=A0AAW0R0X8_9PEZI